VPSFVALDAAAPGLLSALFVPEHGLTANRVAGEDVLSGWLRPGIPIHSLYVAGRHGPLPEHLAELDLLVIDLPDIGSRYYTYPATMINCIRVAAGLGLPVLVLDRPNPLGGVGIEGPGVAASFRSLVGPLDTPVVHGLTIGEIARLALQAYDLAGADVEVVPMQGWDAAAGWDATRLIWYPPSPAAATPTMATAYPGTCLLEGTNISEGRGTGTPFEILGASWIDGEFLARALAPAATELGWELPVPVRFVPSSGQYAGHACGGVRLTGARRDADPRPVALGVAIISTIAAEYPLHFAWLEPAKETTDRRMHIDLLAGGPWLRAAIDARLDWHDIVAGWPDCEEPFLAQSADALIYPRPAGRRGATGAGASAGRCRIIRSAARALDRLTGTALAEAMIKSVPEVAAALDALVQPLGAAIDAVAARLAAGGRLIYVGAGTSGRLGVLDASECIPTFGTLAGRVVAVIAGGSQAVTEAVEGAEDDAVAGGAAIADLAVGPLDAVVGIAASGHTPYTVAALRAARGRGALTVAVTAQPGTPLAACAAIALEALVGDELLRGSTRLKAGTAHKVILNAISTGAFARTGHVYGNLMVGVQPSNAKLRARAIGLVAEIAGVDPAAAETALAAATAVDSRLAVRIAILSLIAAIDATQACQQLTAAGGSLRMAVTRATGQPPA
jgi:N-acetylmuramic acid 6-phosphate etherase